MTDPKPSEERKLPVDPKLSANKQSLFAARIAEELGLPIVFRWPLDMGDPNHRERHLTEFEDLPEDPDGMYYVYYLISEDGERNAVHAAEGDVRVVMFHLALRIGGRALADKFQYRWDLYAKKRASAR